MVKIPLTEEMAEEEQKVINIHETWVSAHDSFLKMQDYLKMITTPIQILKYQIIFLILKELEI